MKDSTKRTIRTVIQGVLGLVAAAPLLVFASGLPAQTAGVGIFLGVCAGATRVMALPAVDNVLPSWLRITAPAAAAGVSASAAPSTPPSTASGGGV